MPQFSPGQFADFNYAGVIGPPKKPKTWPVKGGAQTELTKIHDLHPVVLVLWWDSKLVHALNFNYFMPNEIIDFFQTILKKKITTETFEDIGSIDHIDIGNPRNFYYNFLKGYLPRIQWVQAAGAQETTGPYRTYLPQKIVNPDRINLSTLFEMSGINLQKLKKLLKK